MGNIDPSYEKANDHDSNATNDENPSDKIHKQYVSYLKSTRQDLDDQNKNHYSSTPNDNQTLILEKLLLLTKQLNDLQNENAQLKQEVFKNKSQNTFQSWNPNNLDD